MELHEVLRLCGNIIRLVFIGSVIVLGGISLIMKLKHGRDNEKKH